MTRHELTPMQEAFVTEYLTCFNCVQAYKMAGYSMDGKYSTITRNAWKVFKNPKVEAEIRRRLEEVKENHDCLVEKMIKQCIDIMDDPETKPTDKIKSMEMLGKLIGLANKVDVKTEGDLSFNIEIVSAEND